MTRAEHLAWCKQRALAYADRGDWENTIQSMLSDLRKHPETERSVQAGAIVAFALGVHPTKHELRNFVEGFN